MSYSERITLFVPESMQNIALANVKMIARTNTTIVQVVYFDKV